MKKINISYALARFVFISLLILGLLSTVLVINRVIDSMQRQQEQLVEGETSAISDTFLLFLNQHMAVLKDQAAGPVIIQSLMQPEENRGIIIDHLASLTMLGQKYQQSLLDFSGDIVYITQSSLTGAWQQQAWVELILAGQLNQHISVTQIDHAHYWLLAAPVAYNNQVEGIVITFIPIADIASHLSFANYSNNLGLSLLRNKQILLTVGEAIEGRKHNIQWPDTGISLQFTVNESAINNEVYEIVIELISLIVFSILVSTAIAYFYGSKLFVRPLKLLSLATDNISQDNSYENLNEQLEISEFSNLFHNFNTMAKQVKSRETELRDSFVELSKVHEDLRLSQAQVIQSEKLASLGVLSAGVAHEINNPISYIKCNLEVLQDYLEQVEQFINEISNHSSVDPDKFEQLLVKYDIKYILSDVTQLTSSGIEGVERVATIVQGLKTFARKDLPDPQIININEGIEATLIVVENELKYVADIKIELGMLPDIEGYPGQINQVILNLLVNASQAINERGEITIRSFVSGSHIVVEVEDTGMGMEKDQLDQIFTPFYTTKAPGQGTGLGLAISYSIIERHHGYISVRSEIDQGSCFSIYLPISQPEA
ncbi:MAG: two-component sensor histidine kinase [Gammaproteobacteria bacterium]|nr:two-component sensor histidine kinase [Gammaproteobacteria bacterium]